MTLLEEDDSISLIGDQPCFMNDGLSDATSDPDVTVPG
jgi:hypothetical protein